MTRRAGYSLFEVLIAFAVMSMMLAVLLPGQAGLLQSADRVSERVLASDYALGQAERVGLDVPAQVSSERWSYRGWQITRDIGPLPGPTPVLDVRVSVRDAMGRPLAEIQTLAPLSGDRQ